MYIIQMGVCMCKHAVKNTQRKHAVMCRDAEHGRSANNTGYKLQLILFRASLKAKATLWRRISLRRAFQRVLPTNVNDLRPEGPGRKGTCSSRCSCPRVIRRSSRDAWPVLAVN